MNKIFYLTAVLMLPVLLFLPVIPAVTVRAQQSENLLLAFLPAGEFFTLKWRHSTELEPWQETYRLQHGKLVLVETRFKAYGAGSPINEGEEVLFQDGWIVIRGIKRNLDSLPLSISQAGNYRLETGEQIINLYDVVRGENNLVIRNQRTGLIYLLYYRLLTQF